MSGVLPCFYRRKNKPAAMGGPVAGYYTDKIIPNIRWTMAGIFCGRGDHRHVHKKRTGIPSHDSSVQTKKIDLILTKSIQRFARNTRSTASIMRASSGGLASLRKKGEYQLSYRQTAIHDLDVRRDGDLLKANPFPGNIQRGRRCRKVGTLKVPCYRLYGYEKDMNGFQHRRTSRNRA